MFTTERLVLRPYRESDRADLLRLRNEPTVQRGLSNQYVVPWGPKQADKLVEGVYNATLYVVITLRDDKDGKSSTADGGTFIGQASIFIPQPKNRDGMYGMSILPQYWNKGYATEVTRFLVDYGFKMLALHRMSLQVLEGNGAAIAVYKKVGFVEEGRNRKVNWIDGHWEDSFSMGILEEEWRNLQTGQ